MSILSKLVIAVAAFILALSVLVQGKLDPRKELFEKELQRLDFDAVKQDLFELITSSDPFFPSDYGNYGPFFIRMAWHCSGTYRIFDGEGGCDGGRQRFEPEQSWGDNTNLDKARRLLYPIKQKYGLGLSWGDLIILAGTASIEQMGGPVLGFCAGRFDDADGTESDILGPSAAQEETAPCPPEQQGDCQAPLGAVDLELIYVNPGGFLGVPEPSNSVDPIRDVFGRMGMNDSETVALIGGGHTFGKTHGACPDGAGPPPREQPENPWPGNCGTGVSVDTFTSGYEGPWTSTPTVFTNNFFVALRTFPWELVQSSGGNNQFVVDRDAFPNPPQAPTVDGEDVQDIAMLVTDLALLEDDNYRASVDMYADDIDAFADAFASVWYKLTTRDMGPVSRCFGPDVPAAQEFQQPLPPPPSRTPPFLFVKKSALSLLSVSGDGFVSDVVNGKAYNGAWFSELAYLCASTFRSSDHFGGCNGARIRFPPESEWEDRAGMSAVIDLLTPVVEAFSSSGLTTADMIVLSGTASLELASDFDARLTYCSGRSDAENGSENLRLFQYEDKALEQIRQARLFDMTPAEYVALQGRPRSVEYMKLLGYSGSYTTVTEQLNNEFFSTLLNEEWTVVEGTSDLPFGSEYTNADGTKFITERDFALLLEPAFLAALFEFAASEFLFLREFEAAWTQLMDADRFDGPVGNLCDNTNARIPLSS